MNNSDNRLHPHVVPGSSQVQWNFKLIMHLRLSLARPFTLSLPCSLLHPTVFAMPRALAISGTTAFLAILHSYVSAQAPPCVPGYEWVRRQLERRLYFFFDMVTVDIQFFTPNAMHYGSSSWGGLC